MKERISIGPTDIDGIKTRIEVLRVNHRVLSVVMAPEKWAQLQAFWEQNRHPLRNSDMDRGMPVDPDQIDGVPVQLEAGCEGIFVVVDD